jgi:hypothetical protein
MQATGYPNKINSTKHEKGIRNKSEFFSEFVSKFHDQLDAREHEDHVNQEDIFNQILSLDTPERSSFDRNGQG